MQSVKAILQLDRTRELELLRFGHSFVADENQMMMMMVMRPPDRQIVGGAASERRISVQFVSASRCAKNRMLSINPHYELNGISQRLTH